MVRVEELTKDLGGGALLVIRHGQTDWNKAKKMQGSSDIPLNDRGREQAHETGKKLVEEGFEFDVLVSSPLSRAYETAQVIGSYFGLEVDRTYPGLEERSYGEAEGLDIPAEQRAHPEKFYSGVEPERDVFTRGVRTLRQIVRDYPGKRVIAVSHGSLIRRTLSAARGAEVPSPIENAIPHDMPLDGLFAWDVDNEPMLKV